MKLTKSCGCKTGHLCNVVAATQLDRVVALAPHLEAARVCHLIPRLFSREESPENHDGGCTPNEQARHQLEEEPWGE